MHIDEQFSPFYKKGVKFIRRMLKKINATVGNKKNGKIEMLKMKGMRKICFVADSCLRYVTPNDACQRHRKPCVVI